ncbi:FadR/GntR family transcriptional regulator [Rhizobium sp. BT-175]|uniref:FadR/GntR family transcriptional regulator n=1 Tax=Rhizobium sp. BT-175 TaxID=2986929 RepID=UPI0035583D17
MSGRYPPGSVLPNEAEICAALSVGRSAVREAVKMLTAKGLVESRPRRGTQVLPSSGWNFFDREVLGWLREGGPDPGIIIRGGAAGRASGGPDRIGRADRSHCPGVQADAARHGWQG